MKQLEQQLVELLAKIASDPSISTSLRRECALLILCERFALELSGLTEPVNRA